MLDIEFSSRRNFIRLGGLSALGLGLPTFLQARGQSATQKQSRAKSVILVYLGGGLSHHDRGYFKTYSA